MDDGAKTETESTMWMCGPNRVQAYGIVPTLMRRALPPFTADVDEPRRCVVAEAGTVGQMTQAVLWEMLFSLRASQRSDRRVMECLVQTQKQLQSEMRKNQDVNAVALMERVGSWMGRVGFHAGNYVIANLERNQMLRFIHTVADSVDSFAARLVAHSTVSEEDVIKQEFVVALLSKCCPALILTIKGTKYRMVPEVAAEEQFRILHCLMPPSSEFSNYLTDFKDRSYTMWRRRVVMLCTENIRAVAL